MSIPLGLVIFGGLVLASAPGDGFAAWIRRELVRGGALVLSLIALAAELNVRGREDLGAGALASAALAGIALAVDGSLALALGPDRRPDCLPGLVLVASRTSLPGTAGFSALWGTFAALAPTIATGRPEERALALAVGMATMVGQARALTAAPIDGPAAAGAPVSGRPEATHGAGRAWVMAAASIAVGLVPGALFAPLARATGSFPAPGLLSLPGWTSWSTVPGLPVAIAAGLGMALAWWINPRSGRAVLPWTAAGPLRETR